MSHTTDWTSDALNYSVETANFLPFNESQNYTGFSPVDSSSPLKPWKKANKSYYQNNRRYFESNSSKPHNKSYRGAFGNNRQGLGYNSNYNSNKGNASFKSDRFYNPKKYLHPSFLEDPWAHLEKSLLTGTSSTSSNSMNETSLET